MMMTWLVVTGTWLDYDFPFSWEWNVIIPTDEVHHFSEGRAQPPTSKNDISKLVQAPFLVLT